MLTIEIAVVCALCSQQGWQADHKTTPERCAELMGRPCEWPQEHHLKPRRRLRVRVRRG